MCSGRTTRYTCGHEKIIYYDLCDDGRNEHWPIAHPVRGLKIRSRRECEDCAEETAFLESRSRQRDEMRAKAVLEFFHGERPLPIPDRELSEICQAAYDRGVRLHPFLNRSDDEPDLRAVRCMLESSFPETGAALFQEMLDRQARIDRTGVAQPTDTQYRLTDLLTRGRERQAEAQVQAEAAPELGRPIHEEQSRTGSSAPIMRDQLAQLVRRLRELQLSLYRDTCTDVDERSTRDADLTSIIDRANAETWQEIERLRSQIRTAHLPLDPDSDDTPEAIGQFALNESTEGQVDAVLGLLREALLSQYELFREFMVNYTGTLENIDADVRTFVREDQRVWRSSDRYFEVIRQRSQLIEGMQNGINSIDAPRRELGLFESDPDSLLNFLDWCRENSDGRFNERELLRDLNGWFQHLRMSSSQLRREWVPFAETFRVAILAGERAQYEFSPLDEVQDVRPLSFRNWCLENVSPAEVEVTPMTLLFADLLERYSYYLGTASSLRDFENFQADRNRRVMAMYTLLDMIPGSPLSRNPTERASTVHASLDFPGGARMRTDIERLSRVGPAEGVDYLQRQLDIERLTSLGREAHAVRMGRLPGYRIEREEREVRESRVRQQTDEQRVRQDMEEGQEDPDTEDDLPSIQRRDDMRDWLPNETVRFTFQIPTAVREGRDGLRSGNLWPHASV